MNYGNDNRVAIYNVAYRFINRSVSCASAVAKFTRSHHDLTGNAPSVRDWDNDIRKCLRVSETTRRIEVALDVRHAPSAAEASNPPPRAFVRARRSSYTPPAFEKFENGIERAISTPSINQPVSILLEHIFFIVFIFFRKFKRLALCQLSCVIWRTCAFQFAFSVSTYQ